METDNSYILQINLYHKKVIRILKFLFLYYFLKLFYLFQGDLFNYLNLFSKYELV
jgi:hypothetical protein